MNVCIITVYNSVNSGSYWQAKILGRVVEGMGHTVYYLERPENGSSIDGRKQVNKIVKVLLKNGVSDAITQYNVMKQFAIARKDFCICKSKDITKMDCFILGSDTIWNIDRKYFRENYEFFFGKEQGARAIPYAASVANTSIEMIKQLNGVQEIVGKWKKIGVRDVHTKDVIEALGGEKIEIVCDPTFLLKKDDYTSYTKTNENQKYIFLYLFKSLNKEAAEALCRFAKEKSCAIINGVNATGLEDRHILNTPYNFIQYMYNAEYIVTDTFHGTIFSVNFEKNFISINRNKTKVNEFLNRIGFSDRLVEEKPHELEKALDKKIDYSQRRNIIQEERTRSYDFLKEALSCIGDRND